MRDYVEREAEDFLEKEGFPIIPRIFVKTLPQALKAANKLIYPIVLKVVGKTILHKSDVGGVKIDIRNEKELKKEFMIIAKIKGREGALVQKFIEGQEVLLGLKKDPVFGHAIAVGAGGIYTEILKDVALRICPIDKQEAENMLEELKSYPLLRGARGGKKVNISALTNVVVQLSKLPKKYPQIKELDINPLIVNEKSAIIADARVIFE